MARAWFDPLRHAFPGGGPQCVRARTVLAAAQRPHSKGERERLVEARYYIGQALLVQGQRDRAVTMLQEAVAAGATSAVVHASARAELKRLGR